MHGTELVRQSKYITWNYNFIFCNFQNISTFKPYLFHTYK